MKNKINSSFELKIRLGFCAALFALATFVEYTRNGLVGLKATYGVIALKLTGLGVWFFFELLFSPTKISIKTLWLPLLAVLLIIFQYWFDPGNFKILIIFSFIFGIVVFLGMRLYDFVYRLR